MQKNKYFILFQNNFSHRRHFDCCAFGRLFEFCSASLQGKIQIRVQMQSSESDTSDWISFSKELGDYKWQSLEPT